MVEIKKSATSEKGYVGHQVTGKVAILHGTAKAVSFDGTVRMLKINSPVFADDHIITGNDGSVSIVFDTFNHTQLDLGRMSNVIIDEDVYGVASPGVSAEASAQQEAIQAALLAGDQPLVLEATAAGVEANAGGDHPVFVVTPDWVHVTPESGAETRGITFGTAVSTNFDPNLAINHPPTIVTDSGNPEGANDIVHESGLPNGSHAGDGSIHTAGTFTVSDPDGLSDIKSVTIDGTTISIADLGHNNVIHGANGDLTVTSYDSATGIAHYTYDLTSPTTNAGGATATNIFTITTTDASVSTSTPATITINIADDAPVAHNDGHSVTEDAAQHLINGNVLDNDASGADAPKGFAAWGSTETDTAAMTDLAKYGTLHLNGDGTWSFDLNNSLPAVQALTQGQTISDSISYTMHDADGSTSSAALTITINGTNDAPHLIVGSALDDMSGSTTPFVYGHSVVNHPDGPGAIYGGNADDILIGDPGGYPKVIPGATANVVFVLDNSSSMWLPIPFGGNEEESRIEALQASAKAALNDLYNSEAENVRVHLVAFNSGTDPAIDLGTYDLTSHGVDNPTALSSALHAVDQLDASCDTTNYETALQSVNDWITGTTSPPLPAPADVSVSYVNEVIFISDGEPNTPDSLASTYTDDVANILSHNFTINAVGTNVGETAMGYLDQVEGASPGSPGNHAADSITTAEQLTTVMGHLAGGTVIQNAAGNDTIQGSDGNDLIYGDSLFTDTLASAAHLTTNPSPGSGWQVFVDLEAGKGTGTYATWTHDDTLNYIKTHIQELGQESGRPGGNDTIDGGAGNDIIFGQEGNDIINGGAGNDIFSGGTGNNILTGGSGADTFIISKDGHDTITDYSKADGDKVDISSVLDTSAGDHLDVIKNADGSVKLEILNSSNVEKASVSFENIHFSDLTSGAELDSLLGKVDVHHS